MFEWIWWVLWENGPVQGSKQGCTYPTMLRMLSGISNRGVISWKMLGFLVSLIPNIWLYFERNKFYAISKTKNLPIFFTSNRSIFAFRERCSDFWLVWYQIYDCTSNETNFTQFRRPKICQFFDVEQVNFRMTLVIWIPSLSMYFLMNLPIGCITPLTHTSLGGVLRGFSSSCKHCKLAKWSKFSGSVTKQLLFNFKT